MLRPRSLRRGRNIFNFFSRFTYSICRFSLASQDHVIASLADEELKSIYFLRQNLHIALYHLHFSCGKTSTLSTLDGATAEALNTNVAQCRQNSPFSPKWQFSTWAPQQLETILSRRPRPESLWMATLSCKRQLFWIHGFDDFIQGLAETTRALCCTADISTSNDLPMFVNLGHH